MQLLAWHAQGAHIAAACIGSFVLAETERIVIAWNGSIESTRAMHHALPLLRLAESVTLIDGHVRTAHNRDIGVIEPDPMVYLMHHGIAVKMHYLDVSAEKAGEALLRKAHEAHADLLVMGGYGHSRIRQRVLGGATRHVMAHAGIPVFMQH